MAHGDLEQEENNRSQLGFPLDAESESSLKFSLDHIIKEVIIDNIRAELTLISGTTSFAVSSNYMVITGASAVTIGIIEGGKEGMILTLEFKDTNVTITDTDTGVVDTINLSTSFVSIANVILQLQHDGISWREIVRSNAGSEWTDTGTLLHPADLSGAEDVVIGGTTAAGADIVLLATGSAIFNEQGADANFRIEGNSDPNLLFLDAGNDLVVIGTTTTLSAKLQITNTGDKVYGLRFLSSGNVTDFFNVTSRPILNLGGASNPTTGTNTFLLYNGTVPSGLPANSGGIYASDVSSSSEVFAIDEAGNSAQLTPHDPITGEWYFYAKNLYTGKEVRVDLERMVKDIEGITGNKYINETFMPVSERVSWENSEEPPKFVKDELIKQGRYKVKGERDNSSQIPDKDNLPK